jgi:hypothetical protein
VHYWVVARRPSPVVKQLRPAIAPGNTHGGKIENQNNTFPARYLFSLRRYSCCWTTNDNNKQQQASSHPVPWNSSTRAAQAGEKYQNDPLPANPKKLITNNQSQSSNSIINEFW